MPLPKDSNARKELPVCRGFLDYFPDAIAAVAEVSRVGNDKHNPGQPIHWAKGKSTDHADALLRHLMQRGGWDEIEIAPGQFARVRHSAEMAWRAMALLQTELEDFARECDEHALHRMADDGGPVPEERPTLADVMQKRHDYAKHEQARLDALKHDPMEGYRRTYNIPRSCPHCGVTEACVCPRSECAWRP